MITRTFDEIRADIPDAMDRCDDKQLFALADELHAVDTPEALAVEANCRGNAYIFAHNHSDALSWLERALKMFEDLGNLDSVGGTALNIGSVYLGTSSFHEAMEWYQRALAVFNETGNKHSATRATVNIGMVHSNLGSYPEAMVWLERALTELEVSQDIPALARVTSAISIVYAFSGSYPEALMYCERSLEYFERVGDTARAAGKVSDIGSIHSEASNHALSLEWHDKACAMYESLNDKNGLMYVIANKGVTYAKLGNQTEALKYYEQALVIEDELGINSHTAWILGDMGNALVELGKSDEAHVVLQRMGELEIDVPIHRLGRIQLRARLLELDGDLDGATAAFQEALDEARTTGLRSHEAAWNESLRNLAQKRNDLNAYIKHNNEFIRINEEIRGKETALKLAMHTKEKEIRADRDEREKEKALLYGALPKHIADRMLKGEDVSGDHFDNAAVLFMDVVAFTQHTHDLPPRIVTQLLDSVFNRIDAICETHSITKIKTIGDAYLAVAFPDEASVDPHFKTSAEQRLALAALEINQTQFAWPDTSPLQFRIGLHNGAVAAGVIGTQRLQYDVWGDTVNIASRLESTCEPNCIHVSESFASAITSAPLSAGEGRGESSREESSQGESSRFNLMLRGLIELKGTGVVKTYWLNS